MQKRTKLNKCKIITNIQKVFHYKHQTMMMIMALLIHSTTTSKMQPPSIKCSTQNMNEKNRTTDNWVEWANSVKKRNPLKPEKELHKVSRLTFTVGHQEPQFDFLATPVLKNAWQDCNNPHPPRYTRTSPLDKEGYYHSKAEKREYE